MWRITLVDEFVMLIFKTNLSPATIPPWIYWYSSDHQSQARPGQDSTCMGDLLGTPDVAGIYFFCDSLRGCVILVLKTISVFCKSTKLSIFTCAKFKTIIFFLLSLLLVYG
jgi:hypothetical protein